MERVDRQIEECGGRSEKQTETDLGCMNGETSKLDVCEVGRRLFSPVLSFPLQLV